MNGTTTKEMKKLLRKVQAFQANLKVYNHVTTSWDEKGMWITFTISNGKGTFDNLSLYYFFTPEENEQLLNDFIKAHTAYVAQDVSENIELFIVFGREPTHLFMDNKWSECYKALTEFKGSIAWRTFNTEDEKDAYILGLDELAVWIDDYAFLPDEFVKEHKAEIDEIMSL